MAPRRVLIIEDQADILEVVALALADEGYEVEPAEHGAEALRIMEAWRPDLILLDLMMPVLNGWELRNRQLADPRWASIPVIVMSARPDAVPESRGLRAAAMLTKPFGLDALSAAWNWPPSCLDSKTEAPLLCLVLRCAQDDRGDTRDARDAKDDTRDAKDGGGWFRGPEGGRGGPRGG